MNPHTGAKEQTKLPTDEYREGWDRIFGASRISSPEYRAAQAAENKRVRNLVDNFVCTVPPGQKQKD